MVYVVTYDLITPGKNYDTVINKIKSFGPCAHALKSAFFVDSEYSEVQMRDALRTVMDINDVFFITKLTSSWQGYLPPEIIAWVAARRLPAF